MIKLSWMKFYVDFFDDARIQVIETMPESDAIYAIWFKLLAFVGKQNASGLFLIHTGGQADDLPITEEVISTVVNKPITTVRLALTTYERLGLIERVDGIYAYTDWDRLVDEERLRRLEERRKQKALGAAGKKRNKEEIIRAYIAEHPDASQRDIARETGVPRTTVQRYLKSIRLLPPSTDHAPTAVAQEAQKVAQSGGPSGPNGRPTGQKTGHVPGHPKQQVNEPKQAVAQNHGQIENKEIDIESIQLAGSGTSRPNANHPSRDAVRDYFAKANLSVDPDRFYDYNEHRGWVTKDGKEIDDWQGLAHRWNTGEHHPVSPQPSTSAAPSVETVMRDFGVDRDTALGMIHAQLV